MEETAVQTEELDVNESETIETTPAEDTGPESMLEAIEQGLKTETDEEKAERLRDEKGRFAAKTEAEAKPEAAKPEDDLAMPDGLSPKAQERFQKLVSKVHEHQQQYQAVTAQVEQFREVLAGTGGSAEDIGSALDYVKMVRNGDLEGALRVLDDQRRSISLALGKPLPGADPLSQFPDLRQRVDAYQMDEQAAIELARSRIQQQQIADQQRQAHQQQEQQQVSAQTRQQAISQIDALGAQWARTDPDFATKETILLKQLPQIAKAFPPHMWASQVKIIYDTLSSMPAPVQNRSAPSPLRPSGQSGGTRQPGSMLEALQSGLGYSGG